MSDSKLKAKFVRYRNCSSYLSLANLDEEVEEYLQSGWIPIGGVAKIDDQFVQTMVLPAANSSTSTKTPKDDYLSD